jgi:hypothetical protein
MYALQADRSKQLFDIRFGQFRGRSAGLTERSGWYNCDGERLGYGDLSLDDMVRIAIGIAENELFIVVPEEAAFWPFVNRQRNPSGDIHNTEPRGETPGTDYVAAHCRYVIARRKIFCVSSANVQESIVGGMKFGRMSRTEVAQIIHEARQRIR